MKVKIEFTVNIDPDAWNLTYGIGDPDEMGRIAFNRAIRDDVREHAENYMHETYRGFDVLTEG